MQYYQECIALGSKSGLSLVSDLAQEKIDRVYDELWRTVFLFERRFSRFLPDSELSVFNRNAGKKQYITPEFRDVLITARDMAAETDGLYNPFILPALQEAGYSHSRVPGHERDAVDNYSQRFVAGVDQLEVGDDWARIPYGSALDIGGCGKGYLADRLRSKLEGATTGFWLSFGGDIAIRGRDEQNMPWTVAVQSADDSTKNVGIFTVNAPCGVATSGTTVHRGEKMGQQWHHIIDPRTNRPAVTDILLATVQDKSSLRADVLASCAVILGSEKAMRFLKSKGVTAAVLQCRNAAGEIDILHFGKHFRLEATHE